MAAHRLASREGHSPHRAHSARQQPYHDGVRCSWTTCARGWRGLVGGLSVALGCRAPSSAAAALVHVRLAESMHADAECSGADTQLCHLFSFRLWSAGLGSCEGELLDALSGAAAVGSIAARIAQCWLYLCVCVCCTSCVVGSLQSSLGSGDTPLGHCSRCGVAALISIRYNIKLDR